VWLSGQKIGTVESNAFRPVSGDTTGRVVIAMDVRQADAAQIRRNSDVRVRAGANLIGPIVVYVTAGTPDSPAVGHGDTLVAAAQSDLQDAARRLGDATKHLGPLMNDARAVMAHARDPKGTIGAFRQSGFRGADVGQLRTGVSALRDQFGGTSAPRARFLTSASRALASVDSVRALLASDRNSIGRFRRDSTLRLSIAHVRDDITTLRSWMEENRGTLGRFSADSAIHRALASAQAELALLMEDLRKRPLRYIAF
jgi:hypothetical protein